MTTASRDLSEQFLSAGGVIMTPEASGYPSLMSERTGYPTLFVLGDMTALHERGIGLCGARDASHVGLELARRAGEVAAELGASLVSGYAKGVDTTGHVSAIQAGGQTTAVLAEGISKFRPRAEYHSLIDPLEQMTIVSIFPLDTRWTVINAMERNKTICSLSQIVVAIEPGSKGGTLNAAQESLRQGTPVIVAWPSDDRIPSQVDRLTKRGAHLVCSAQELEDALRQAFSPDRSPRSQSTLFD